MIMPDYPIENSDEDKLRRTPLAKKVAELIAGFQGKQSFVIGIEGVWGSGKTSFINLALNELKDDPNLIFVNFNPWNFSGQNELITYFFSVGTYDSTFFNWTKIYKLFF
jgi:predicted KAP-like P-loop ATPase